MKFIKLTVCLLCMNLSFSQSQSFVRLNFLDYYIEKDFFVKSYAEAEQQCEMIETTLAIVNTKEIQDFLLDNIGNLTDFPYSFYIGLRKINSVGNGNDSFQWIDGTPLQTGYSNWFPGEPNNVAEAENCVLMGWPYDQDSKYEWRDVDCQGWQSLFICQKPVPVDFRNIVRADIMLLLDDSGSVRYRDFQEMLNWVTELLQKFSADIDEGNTQVGVVVFNSAPRIEISLERHLNYTRLISEILSILNEGGSTRIGRAIADARSEFTSHGRRNVSQIMIVLTDGMSNDNEEVESQAARDSGIITMAVGVGSAPKFESLLKIAGNSSNVYSVTDYSKLNNILEGLQQTIEVAAGMLPNDDALQMFNTQEK